MTNILKGVIIYVTDFIIISTNCYTEHTLNLSTYIEIDYVMDYITVDII